MDEHRENIVTTAAAQGSVLSEHCDVISKEYKTLWKDVILTQDSNSQLSLAWLVECSNCCAYFLFFIISFVLLFAFCLQLNIFFDKFIRTTDPKHEAIVKEFYSMVLFNGDIYLWRTLLCQLWGVWDNICIWTYKCGCSNIIYI